MLTLIAVGVALCAAGCLYVPPEDLGPPPPRMTPSGAIATSTTFDRADEGRLSEGQLGQLVQGFADRYYALISSACDFLARATEAPNKRLVIDRFQSRTVNAVYDIASNPDPFTQLLDLTVVVTLTAIIQIDEGQADQMFGESLSDALKRPLRKGREEVWEIAGRAMNAEQLETLDRLILEWRRANPDVESVSFVRFDDFATSRGKSVIADVRTGSGFLAPVDEAKKAVNEARLFGERVFYMAKRAPLLISMESGQLMSQVAATPEMQHAVDIGTRLAASADRVTTVAESLPKTLEEERQHLVETVDATSGSVRATLQDYNGAVERTDVLVDKVKDLSASVDELVGSIDTAAGSLTETIEAADRLAAGFRPAPGAEAAPPTDPKVYARIAADLRGSLVEVNKALEGTQVLGESTVFTKPIEALDKVSRERVDHASAKLQELVDTIFVRGAGLLVLLFVLLILYRTYAVWLTRRAGPS